MMRTFVILVAISVFGSQTELRCPVIPEEWNVLIEKIVANPPSTLFGTYGTTPAPTRRDDIQKERVRWQQQMRSVWTCEVKRALQMTAHQKETESYNHRFDVDECDVHARERASELYYLKEKLKAAATWSEEFDREDLP